MAKCPKCGMEVSTPRRSWKMAGRPFRSGKRTELTIGIFDHCGTSVRPDKKKLEPTLNFAMGSEYLAR